MLMSKHHVLINVIVIKVSITVVIMNGYYYVLGVRLKHKYLLTVSVMY